MQTGARRMLGELLLEMGLLDRAQLHLALVHHHQARVPLGQAVIREGLCTETEVLRALSEQLGIERVDLELPLLDRTLTALVPPRVARQYRVIPLRLERREREILHVALPAPVSLEAVDAVRAVSGKPRVEPHLAADSALARALAALYGIEEAAAPAPAPSPGAPVLLYGWPPVTAVLMTRLLARHGLAARTATPLEIMRTRPEEVVVAPIPALEGLLVEGVRIAGALLVHGTSDAEDLARANRLGARGLLAHPLDEELLVRAIRRLRPADT